MKILGILVFVLCTHQALAREIPEEFFRKNPDLVATAQSLTFGKFDWPNVDLDAIKHCLTELKKEVSKRKSMEDSERLTRFDECAGTWSTVEIKTKDIISQN